MDPYSWHTEPDVAKREIHYRYRGDDESLSGCEAVDLSIRRDGSPFIVRGTAIRIFSPGRRNGLGWGTRPMSFEKVRGIFYTSWVGFLKDWASFQVD